MLGLGQRLARLVESSRMVAIIIVSNWEWVFVHIVVGGHLAWCRAIVYSGLTGAQCQLSFLNRA